MYRFNLTPIELFAGPGVLHIWKEPQADTQVVSPKVVIPFLKHSQEEEWSKHERIYIFLGEVEKSKKADLSIPIGQNANFEQKVTLARMQLAKVVKEMGLTLKYNLFNELEGWVAFEKGTHFETFKKYQISIRPHYDTNSLYLNIQYLGVSKIFNTPIGTMDNALYPELKWVLFNHQIFHKDGFTKEERPSEANGQNSFAVLNTSLEELQGIKRQVPAPGRNAFKEKVEENIRMTDTLVNHPAFRSYFTLPKGKTYLEPLPSSVFHLSQTYKTLRVGNHVIGDYIPSIIQHGPVQPSPYPKVKFFFIVHKSDAKSMGNKLWEAIKGEGSSFGSMFESMTLLKPDYHTEHIVFENEQNPLIEIEETFNSLSLAPDTHYFALYISRIQKYESDKEKRLIYFRIKEFLLHKQIPCQVISKKTIDSSRLRYSLQNIFVSMLAKLKGKPWELETKESDDLIIGVGAFRSPLQDTTCIGSAISFNAKGDFQAFDCFKKNNPRLLAGAIQEAVVNYVKEKGSCSRLIIHFYKRMSRKEIEPIQERLKKLGLNIPVFVVTIYDTRKNNVVLYEDNDPEYLPLSGTYVRLPFTHHSYLLYNNVRYSTNKPPKKYHHPLKVHLWATNENMLNNPATIELLIAQLCQFSRLYYKSVSFQPMPVTVKYPKLVAEQFPYFLGRTLPEYGRRHLWFL